MRLFVAVDLPRSIRTRLSFLAGGIPGLRWVPPEDYHGTLRFIGELPNWRADEVDQALANIRVPAFPLQLAGVGIFEKAGKTSSLWIGVERTPALDHLQTKIETALTRAGVERERRRFAPHVTMARLDKSPDARIAGWVQTHNLFRSEVIPVEHFTLFSSLLGKEQAVYEPEVEYPLTSGVDAMGAGTQEEAPGWR